MFAVRTFVCMDTPLLTFAISDHISVVHDRDDRSLDPIKGSHQDHILRRQDGAPLFLGVCRPRNHVTVNGHFPSICSNQRKGKTSSSHNRRIVPPRSALHAGSDARANPSISNPLDHKLPLEVRSRVPGDPHLIGGEFLLEAEWIAAEEPTQNPQGSADRGPHLKSGGPGQLVRLPSSTPSMIPPIDPQVHMNGQVVVGERSMLSRG